MVVVMMVMVRCYECGYGYENNAAPWLRVFLCCRLSASPHWIDKGRLCARAASAARLAYGRWHRLHMIRRPASTKRKCTALVRSSLIFPHMLPTATRHFTASHSLRSAMQKLLLYTASTPVSARDPAQCLRVYVQAYV